MRANEAQAEIRVRLHRTGGNDQHHVAHHGEHAIVARRSCPEEVWRVAEVLLDAEDAVRGPERNAPVQTLLIAVGEAQAAYRVALEVVADKSRNDTVCPKRSG